MDDLVFVRDDKLLVDRDGNVFFVDENDELVQAVSCFQPDLRQYYGGYMYVEYWDSEVQKTLRAVTALLLAEAFIPNPTKARHITYQNGDPKCVTLENIIWRTSEKKKYKDRAKIA